jgi:kanamycin kinase
MTALPVDLVDRYADWTWERAWETTYAFGRAGEKVFVKLAPAGQALPDEAQRLRWAAPWLPVPAVVEYGTDGETDWLITRALPGADATRHPWYAEDPGRLAATLGLALKDFHRRVPPRECPFDFTVPSAVAHVKARLAAGLVLAGDVERLLASVPEPSGEVVCHGDYCLPNVILTGDAVTGFVDLGRLAVADPWSDLAIGAGSVIRNLGPGYDEAFFVAYGVDPDPDRLAWYRLLYDLS